MSQSENEQKRNFWTSFGLSFRTRLVIGLGVLLILALVWMANSVDMPAFGFVLIPFMAMTYLLPTLIAVSRKHTSLGPIFALNLFLGWSLLGWVAALVWALTRPKPDEPVIVETPQASTADELAKLAELRDKGILTADEFEARKKSLLS
ncbi:superinfection immunity protein [Maricaulis sp.]|uniref:superinfection immunity protein n=1 Tax=Maricaulis sp. TaxID=1486257 RepID=UPI003A908872